MKIADYVRREILRSVNIMAPDAGFEPATKWLTATYSTAELIRNTKGCDLLITAEIIV